MLIQAKVRLSALTQLKKKETVFDIYHSNVRVNIKETRLDFEAGIYYDLHTSKKLDCKIKKKNFYKNRINKL